MIKIGEISMWLLFRSLSLFNTSPKRCDGPIYGEETDGMKFETYVQVTIPFKDD